jgi:hypothetical protein
MNDANALCGVVHSSALLFCMDVHIEHSRMLRSMCGPDS